MIFLLCAKCVVSLHNLGGRQLLLRELRPRLTAKSNLVWGVLGQTHSGMNGGGGNAPV